MPRRSAYNLASRLMLHATPGLALCLALAGCVSTPLQNRDWVQVQTQHYDVWSSLPLDDSLRLAVDLEHFRAATAYISGRPIPAGRGRHARVCVRRSRGRAALRAPVAARLPVGPSARRRDRPAHGRRLGGRRLDPVQARIRAPPALERLTRRPAAVARRRASAAREHAREPRRRGARGRAAQAPRARAAQTASGSRSIACWATPTWAAGPISSARPSKPSPGRSVTT